MIKKKNALQFFIILFILSFSKSVYALASPQISARNLHTLALRSDGSVFSWGRNVQNQLGDGTSTNRLTPIRVKDVGGVGYLTHVKQVNAGYFHSFAIKEDGTLLSWGTNSRGQLGDGTTTTRALPTKVVGPGGVGYLTNVIQVSSGYRFAATLKSDGTVWTFGENTNGQLGDGTNTDRWTPVQVKDPSGSGYLTNIIQISAGAYYTLALKDDGTVYSFGLNDYGQLGNGTYINSTLPTKVKDSSGTGYLANVKDISAGGYHSLVLKNDGTVYAWGDDGAGQLGDGTYIKSPLPVKVKDSSGTGYLTNVKQVSASTSSSSILKNDGTIYSFGANNYGSFGDGTTTGHNLPVQAKDSSGTGYLTNINQISAGGGFISAMKNDGTLYSSGYNLFGELGINSTTDKYFPVQVLGGETLDPYFTLMPIFTTVTVGLSPGTFSFTTPMLTRNFASYTLSTTYPNLTADLSSIDVVDWSGTADGWNLALTASQFTDENNNKLPIDSLSIEPPISVIKTSSNNSILPSIVSGTQIVGTTAIELLTSNIGQGLGSYHVAFNTNALHLNFDPTKIKLDNDGNSTFSSTLTWTLSTGP